MFKTAVSVFRSFEFRYCFVLRISNFELPSQLAPRTFPHPPPEGRASFSTINDVTMRLVEQITLPCTI